MKVCSLSLRLHSFSVAGEGYLPQGWVDLGEGLGPVLLIQLLKALPLLLQAERLHVVPGRLTEEGSQICTARCNCSAAIGSTVQIGPGRLAG